MHYVFSAIHAHYSWGRPMVICRTSCGCRSKIEKLRFFGLWASDKPRTSCLRPGTMRCEHLDRQVVLASRLGAFLTPSPCPAKLTCKHNSMLTYIPVSFLFSFKNFVPVRVKNRVRVTWVRVSSRVRV